MRYALVSILALGLSCSKAQLPMVPETSTELNVTAINKDGSRVDSVQVFLDGKLVGLTPYKNSDIRLGLRSLRLQKASYQAFLEQLHIEGGQSYHIEALLEPLPPTEGELIVTVNEDSAMVTIKDSQDAVLARTGERASTHLLQPGHYIVSGEKSGRSPIFKTVEVKAGYSVSVDLEFASVSIPPDLTFNILEDSVQFNQPLNLTWRSNGHQVIIDHGVGVRGPNGSEKLICPSAGLKVFTAAAYSREGLITEVSDSVVVLPPRVTLEFSASPDTLTYGEPVFLNWRSDGFQVVIDHGVGVRGPEGSEEVYFRNPGKKILTATAYGDNNHFILKQDSVFIKEAPDPVLPVIALSTTRLVTVGTPANISWFAKNADYVYVDYVQSTGLEGSAQVTFNTEGVRIVTATAYNRAGYSSVTDTIEVVEPEVEVVDDIMVSAEASVRADKGESGFLARRVATFEIKTSGDYAFQSNVWYNSGDSQLNESFYLELTDAMGNIIRPKDPNAGAHHVVPDEPGEPHTSWRPSGTFNLSAGTYSIDVYHYAKISSTYPQHLFGPIAGPESVKLKGFKGVFVNQE